MASYVWTGATDSAWGTAGNWTPSGPPATSGDSALFDGRAAAALTGSDVSATTLDALTQTVACTKAIGSVAAPLEIGATVVELGRPAGDGSITSPGQVHLDLGSAASTVIVHATASTGTAGAEPVTLTGSHTSNSLTVRGGTVGVATRLPSDTASFPSMTISGTNAKLRCGSGATITTLNVFAGDVVTNSAITTLNQHGGEVQTNGTGAVTTATVMGGTLTVNSTGTITTLNVEGEGAVNFDLGTGAITVTNAFVRGKGAKIIDTRKRVTWTNGIDLLDGASSTQVNLGTDVTITPSAI